jgi:mono/diheme cytochrome c family protein
VLFLLVVAWAMFYWFAAWAPPPEYANSPTFSTATAVGAAALEGPEPGPTLTGVGDFDWAVLGQRVYEQHCQICHAANGEGIPNFVPTLQGTQIVLADDPTEHLRRIFIPTGLAEQPGRRWKAWMPGFAELLTDEEVAAVANYQRTHWGNSAGLVGPEQAGAIRRQSGAPSPARTAPATAQRPQQPAPSLAAESPRWAALGAELYEGRCQACHTASGEGIPNFSPSLRGSAVVAADDPARQVRHILFGSSGVERGPDYPWAAWMPAFGELFSDEEVAAVANHERTSWGNNAALVRPEQVRAARAASTGAP